MSVTNKQDQSFLEIIWDFFCSLKLAITTLILLALTSIIGTVVQQGKPAQEYIQEYGERVYRVFVALDFVDMYHSWWFLTLLNIFAINLICCSIKRLPRILKLVKHPVLTPDEKHYRRFANRDEFTVPVAVDRAGDRLAVFMRKHFAAPVVTARDGRTHLFAQKMAWARFGVYVVHLSILIIFAGAIIGSVWGYKAYVNIAEGTSTDKVWPRDSQNPIAIGFEVRCDNFEVTYYPGTRRPKEFTSDLVVLEGGREVLKKTIEVNDPLSYRGLTFYQSSYGPAGEPVFKLTVTERSSGRKLKFEAQRGEHIALPDGSSFAVSDYTDSYKSFGPAIQMHLNDKTGKHGNAFVVFQRFPEFDAQRGGAYSFAVDSFEQQFYTGLQVAKDPGVWVVWTGCFLLVAGCFSAFFLSHRRIWLTIEPAGDGSLVRVAGNAHRNQPAFEIFFEDFKSRLKEELTGRQTPESSPLPAVEANT
ncbi:hypothetical protein B5V00_07160 [Geothermobacter hydrogeniphilus]|uniref:ResB-like domain-containing protein n=1 Tax=Geothermobacter hydrogeniphilus TaxID=1969733 RepID=A0A1X0Y6A9_9BACT|nr:hypothetical protein B5V00_07160 [Geothermobacter hydrogeniphilus]